MHALKSIKWPSMGGYQESAGQRTGVKKFIPITYLVIALALGSNIRVESQNIIDHKFAASPCFPRLRCACSLPSAG